ncbi:MAG: cobaltochelatase subunit CobN [Gammaproteobacteria bacterium]|nr:cobaltochelatase subunit CobN [Gammaproteobacteria bacterium]
MLKNFFRLNIAIVLSAVCATLLLPMSAAADAREHLDKSEEYRILIVTGRHSNRAKVSLLKKVIKESASPGAFSIETKSDKNLGEVPEALQEFSKHHLVILDTASARTSKKNYEKYQGRLNGLSNKIFAIQATDNSGLRVGISEPEAETIHQYYENGGEENFKRLEDFLKYRVQHSVISENVAEPIIYPEIGLYHPDYENLIFPSREAYTKWRGAIQPGKRVVALNLQRASIESNQTTLIDEAIKRIEAKGHYALPFFFELSPSVSDYSALIQENTNGRVETVADVIINFRSIHWANKRKQEFEKFGIPVVQAITHYDGDQKAWEESEEGISSAMLPFTLVLPESAGIIDPIVVAAMNHRKQQIEVIDYQLEFLVEKALNYAGLAVLSNADKKITTMFWGDQDMGASFLNVPESLQSISHRLNEEGYSVDKRDSEYFINNVERILTPFYREYELEALIDDDLAELLPLEDYRKWLQTVPRETADGIIEHWGQPEDNFMITERDGKKYFVIPRIRNGNMLILRQPPRGDSADTEQGLYHNTKIPMNHYYLAAYFYARDYWNSDVFIHLGTHGTHEYLPGKDRGLSRYDGANLSTGTLPIVYPYIIDDVGEAIQAKRRGNAVIVSHMTPPFAAAGLQGVTADMHTLVDQYRHIDTGGVKEKTKQHIIDLCHEENLCKDLNYDQAQIDADFDAFLQALHDYLEELASANQPLGLHTFGELPEQRLVISTLGQMLGNEFLGVAADFEKDHYEHEDHHDHGDDHGDEHGEEHEEISDGLMHFVDEDLENTAGFKTLRDFVVNKGDDSELSREIRPYIAQAKQYYEDITGIKELDNLVAGLNGEYIPPKNGGDPVRNPGSLPTGFNIIGFDPSRLPTKAAFEQGTELAEELIANYYKKHGQYPDKLAFSLWSVEAMRHYGVLESQALYAMGIRPQWSDDGRVIGTEIIPASELKRPRVDVVLSATGLYRDAFPNVMEMLAKAVKELSELKEAGNSIWDNSQKVKEQLIAEGVDAEEAEYLSSVRIFANAFGQYGSGVDEPIMQSDTWETDEKIADNYLATVDRVFGADRSRWGQKIEGLYAKQLSGTDVALFARSSNLYGMITSDDPFEYFGSLALAVRNIDGKSPEMIISNLRNPKKAKMETAADMLAKELRTRNFHKRWITEMQKEGYSGAVTMSGNLANFWGWQVVDPNVVRNDQWGEFFEVYIEDKYELGLNEWFEEVNPKSQAQMLERMLEAVRKEYWEADEATLQTMIERYQELITQYDLMVDNEKLREFVNQQAIGFGLDMTLPAPTDALLASQDSQSVEGQQLEKVDSSQADSKEDKTIFFIILACLVMIAVGALRQARYKSPEFA